MAMCVADLAVVDLVVKMRRHVIYLPGVNDNKIGQRILVKHWYIYGVRPHYHYIGWADTYETFTQKLNKLLQRIDILNGSGKVVSLVASSAGASMAIHALAERPDKLQRVITICGKLRRPETVNDHYRLGFPPFFESISSLGDSLKKIDKSTLHKVVNIRPIYDNVVDVEDMGIDGCRSYRIATRGHAMSISLALTFFAPRIIKLIKETD